MRLGFVLCHLMHTLAVASLRGLMNAGSLTPLHSPGPKSFIWAPPSNRHYPETYSKQVKMKGRRIEKREGRMDKAHWRKTDGWLIWLSLHLSLHQASFSWAKCCEKFNSSFFLLSSVFFLFLSPYFTPARYGTNSGSRSEFPRFQFRAFISRSTCTLSGRGRRKKFLIIWQSITKVLLRTSRYFSRGCSLTGRSWWSISVPAG